MRTKIVLISLLFTVTAYPAGKLLFRKNHSGLWAFVKKGRVESKFLASDRFVKNYCEKFDFCVELDPVHPPEVGYKFNGKKFRKGK